MGQPAESPPNHGAMLSSSPLNWDGKCQNCRRLMSRCTCFQESESDTDPLHTSAASQVAADAAETRPLWNALRKMHRKSTATRLSLMQAPPTSSRPSDSSSKEHRKRSEALPPLGALAASVTSTSSSRHHLHRRSNARPPQSSRRGSREPRRETSPDRLSISRKDRLQRAGITTSSHNLKGDVKDAGAMRTVQSTSSIGLEKHSSVSVSRPKEKFSYEPEEGPGPSDEDEEAVWEL